jgi:hypothetical protein
MAVCIANSGKNIKFDCVDTWRGSNEPAHTNDPAVINDTLYQEFLSNIEPVKHIITPVRAPSVEAAKLYEDNSLDFILLDGSHEYQDVYDDIVAWFFKLKPGGLLVGDDYSHYFPGVIKAADELLAGHGVASGCWTFIKPLD